MKIIILSGGYVEYEIKGSTPGEILKLANELYRLLPNATIYIDYGKGLIFFDPKHPDHNKNLLK